MMTSEVISSEVRQIVQDALEIRYPERHYLRDQVLFELVTSQLAAEPEYLKGADLSWGQRDDQAKKIAADDVLWDYVKGIVELADTSLTRSPDDGQQLKRWFPPPPQRLDGKKDVDDSASLETLRDCAIMYSRAEWARSPALELWLVRQMIFAETFAFSREIGIPFQYKSFKFWWMWIKSLVKWAIGLAVAFSVGDTYGPAFGVFTYVAWLGIVRFLATDQLQGLQKVTETFMAMRNSYVLSLRTPPCPVEIEKSLSIAEEHSAVWPAGLRSLVERGLSRNREYWK